MARTAKARERLANYPKLTDYKPTRFMLPESHYDATKADRAVRFIENLCHSSSNLFSAKLICGCCGGYFGSKVWHSTSKYRRVIWQCNHKFRNGEKCTTPHLYEDEIKRKFITVCGMVGEDKDDFLASCREITEALCDSAELDKHIENLLVRADELTAVMQGFIRENAEHEQDQDLYNHKYAEYEEQMNTVDAELQRLRQKKADQIARKELLEGMIREIVDNDLTVTEFDEKLWRFMVESVEVDENGKLVFTLRNGMEIEV